MREAAFSGSSNVWFCHDDNILCKYPHFLLLQFICTPFLFLQFAFALFLLFEEFNSSLRILYNVFCFYPFSCLPFPMHTNLCSKNPICFNLCCPYAFGYMVTFWSQFRSRQSVKGLAMRNYTSSFH